MDESSAIRSCHIDDCYEYSPISAFLQATTQFKSQMNGLMELDIKNVVSLNIERKNFVTFS